MAPFRIRLTQFPQSPYILDNPWGNWVCTVCLPCMVLHCSVQQVEVRTQNEALKRTCWIMHGCVKERIFISLPQLNHLPLLFPPPPPPPPPPSSLPLAPSLSLLHQLKWLCGFMRQPFKSLPFPHWSRQKVIGSIKRIKSPRKME